MGGDWRKILWIYSSIIFLSCLIWLLISTHPESFRYVGYAVGMFFAAAEIGRALGPLRLGLLSDYDEGFQSGLPMLDLICLILVVLVFFSKFCLLHNNTEY